MYHIIKYQCRSTRKKYVLALLIASGTLLSFLSILETVGKRASVETKIQRLHTPEHFPSYQRVVFEMNEHTCPIKVKWPPLCERKILMVDEDRRCRHSVSPSSFKDNPVLPEKAIDAVKFFVVFVGHARSGTSITGALLDAHPHVILSNEFYILHQMASYPSLYASKRGIMDALAVRQRRVVKHFRESTRKGYSLYINGSSMGSYMDHVNVIGDKAAGSTVGLYMANPKKFASELNKLKQTINLPLKFIQVLRNPFDTIATKYIYDTGGVKLRVNIGNGSIAQEGNSLDCPIQEYFQRTRSIVEMSNALRLDLHQVHLSDLIARPREEVMKMCSFLQLQCDRDYLRICEKAMFQEASHTRHKVEWTNQQIDTVHQLIQKFTFLRRYNFSSD